MKMAQVHNFPSYLNSQSRYHVPSDRTILPDMTYRTYHPALSPASGLSESKPHYEWPDKTHAYLYAAVVA